MSSHDGPSKRLLAAVLLLCAFLSAVGLPGPVRASEREIVVTRIVPATGRAFRNEDQQLLSRGDRITENDLIRTSGDTWVQLLFLPACQVWIGPGSQVVVAALKPMRPAEQTTFQLLVGQLRVTLAHLGFARQDVVIDAESVLAAPRGTDFAMTRTGAGEVTLAVFEGLVEATFGGQVLSIPAGQLLIRPGDGQAPVRSSLPTADARPAASPPVSQQGPGADIGVPQPPETGAAAENPLWMPTRSSLDPFYDASEGAPSPLVTPRLPWSVVLPPP